VLLAISTKTLLDHSFNAKGGFLVEYSHMFGFDLSTSSSMVILLFILVEEQC
jgi:hypothetical protein